MGRGAPDGLGRRRHRDVLMAERVGERVDHRGRRSDRARFAATLEAERIGRARRGDGRDIVRRQIVGARHGVVHEARGDELPVRVVSRAFQQRLTDALRDSAMHLPLDDHRVDQFAEIIDGRPTIDGHDAGLRIDFEFADMHARREGEVGGVPERALLEARLDFVPGELVRAVGRQRQ